VCFWTTVCCGKTAGLIRIPLCMEVGLGPDNVVLDGDPAPTFWPTLLSHGSQSQQLLSSCSGFILVVCFCCVTFSFFSTTPRDWLSRKPPKWRLLCQVERKTVTQSIQILLTMPFTVWLQLLIPFLLWMLKIPGYNWEFRFRECMAYLRSNN